MIAAFMLRNARQISFDGLLRLGMRRVRLRRRYLAAKIQGDRLRTTDDTSR